MNAVELRALVLEALAPVAGEVAAVEPLLRLDVRGTSHVRAALGCPAATALEGESPFEPSPALAGWQVAATLTDRLVHGHPDPRRGPAPADPAAAFRAAWAEGERLDDWAWSWLRAEPTSRGTRAVTAAEARGRVAALARLLPEWPLAVSHVGHRPGWTHPGRALRLVGRSDLVLGRRDGTHRLVVVLHGDHGPSTRARVAFEAVVESLVLRRPPAEVLVLLPDAGRRWAVTVDDALLREGVEVAAAAAAVALGVRRRDAEGLARRPSTRCRTCPYATGCEAGSGWLRGAGRLASGFIPVPN